MHAAYFGIYRKEEVSRTMMFYMSGPKYYL